jgi:hypothetical protein
VAAPTAPANEPTQSATDVLPAPEVVPAPDSSPPAVTKVAGSHLVGRPSRLRFASSGQEARMGRVIPADARSASPSVAVRPRPLQARSKKPKTPTTRSTIEVSPRSLVPASSRVSLFGDWFALSLALSSAFAVGLLLMAIALPAGRSLRTRVGSKGLSDDHSNASRRGGIRYRE